jgi:hypothetical protein
VRHALAGDRDDVRQQAVGKEIADSLGNDHHASRKRSAIALRGATDRSAHPPMGWGTARLQNVVVMARSLHAPSRHARQR